MRKRRRLPARGLAGGVALVLALQVVSVPAQAAPSGDFEQLMAEADGHADAQRHAEALDAYIGAFEAMPDELKTSEIGEFVALAAAKSAIADFEEGQDTQSLERGRAVLVDFIERASGADGAPSVDPAQEQLAEIDALMPLEDSFDEDPSPIPSDETPQDTGPTDQGPPPDRRGAALGLIIGGSLGAVAGLSLVIAGARQVPWYKDQLEERGWTPDTQGYTEQLIDARRVRNIDIGVGVTLLVVGGALAAGGGVLLSRESKGSGASASLVPSLRRDGFGLSARLRF